MSVVAVLDHVRGKVTRIWDSLLTAWICWLAGIRRNSGVMIQGPSIVRTRNFGEIVLGTNVRFNARSRSNLVGIANPTILDTRFGGHIEIGADSGLSSPIISSKSAVVVGKNCMIGANVRIFDHDFHPMAWEDRRPPQKVGMIRSRPVSIGDDCFIGTNVIILKGTQIGARSVVGAGSVLAGLQVPPDSLVKGNPAIVVSSLRSERKNG